MYLLNGIFPKLSIVALVCANVRGKDFIILNTYVNIKLKWSSHNHVNYVFCNNWYYKAKLLNIRKFNKEGH